MHSSFWRHVRLAFTSRGPYDPTGRDQEIARLRALLPELRKAVHEHDQRWEVMASGYPRESDEDKALELFAGIVHVHNHVYGAYPDSDRVYAALDALGVPRGDAS